MNRRTGSVFLKVRSLVLEEESSKFGLDSETKKIMQFLPVSFIKVWVSFLGGFSGSMFGLMFEILKFEVRNFQVHPKPNLGCKFFKYLDIHQRYGCVCSVKIVKRGIPIVNANISDKKSHLSRTFVQTSTDFQISNVFRDHRLGSRIEIAQVYMQRTYIQKTYKHYSLCT